MKRLLAFSAAPALAMLGACEPDNRIVTTNDTNVVLNDFQADYASTNDDELPANESGATGEMTMPDNGSNTIVTP